MFPRRTLNGIETAALMRHAARLLDAVANITGSAESSYLCADELVAAAIAFEDADAYEKRRQDITPPTITIKNEVETRVKNANIASGPYQIITDIITDL